MSRTSTLPSIEHDLDAAYKAIEQFHENIKKSKVSENTLVMLQKKIETVKSQLEHFNAPVPQANQKIKNQVLDSIDRVSKETLVMMSGMQAQINIVMGALKDLKRLLRKGERVEDTGKSEQQGY